MRQIARKQKLSIIWAVTVETSDINKKHNDHLILPKFLLKNFATSRDDDFSIFVLDINRKTVSPTNCIIANTALNFYDDEIEKCFSQLESKFANLCKSIFDNLDKNDDTVLNKLNSIPTKALIKEWAKTNYGRIFFNNPKNISLHINSDYDKRKRNTVIKKIINEPLPKSANDFVDNAYITLFRNSSDTNFVLGSCHWIETDQIYDYGAVLFPISPKLAICIIEMKWRKDIKNQIKKNDIAYLNYAKGEFVNAFNNVVLKHTQEVGLNEIYSCNEKELDELNKSI